MCFPERKEIPPLNNKSRTAHRKYPVSRPALLFESGWPAGHLIQNGHDFIQLGFHFLGSAAGEGILDASSQMGPDDLLVGLAEDRDHCQHLIGDVNAVPVLIDHLEDSVQLSPGGFDERDYLVTVGFHGRALLSQWILRCNRHRSQPWQVHRLPPEQSVPHWRTSAPDPPWRLRRPERSEPSPPNRRSACTSYHQ